MTVRERILVTVVLTAVLYPLRPLPPCEISNTYCTKAISASSSSRQAAESFLRTRAPLFHGPVLHRHETLDARLGQKPLLYRLGKQDGDSFFIDAGGAAFRSHSSRGSRQSFPPSLRVFRTVSRRARLCAALKFPLKPSVTPLPALPTNPSASRGSCLRSSPAPANRASGRIRARRTPGHGRRADLAGNSPGSWPPSLLHPAAAVHAITAVGLAHHHFGDEALQAAEHKIENQRAAIYPATPASGFCATSTRCERSALQRARWFSTRRSVSDTFSRLLCSNQPNSRRTAAMPGGSAASASRASISAPSALSSTVDSAPRTRL